MATQAVEFGRGMCLAFEKRAYVGRSGAGSAGSHVLPI
jgi:hypothetical protein